MLTVTGLLKQGGGTLMYGNVFGTTTAYMYICADPEKILGDGGWGGGSDGCLYLPERGGGSNLFSNFTK